MAFLYALLYADNTQFKQFAVQNNHDRFSKSKVESSCFSQFHFVCYAKKNFTCTQSLSWCHLLWSRMQYIQTGLHSRCLLQLDLKQDAQILMAKVFYVVGDYSTTLARLEALNLDKINIESSSNRKMRLIGEAYAIKGMS